MKLSQDAENIKQMAPACEITTRAVSISAQPVKVHGSVRACEKLWLTLLSLSRYRNHSNKTFVFKEALQGTTVQWWIIWWIIDTSITVSTLRFMPHTLQWAYKPSYTELWKHPALRVECQLIKVRAAESKVRNCDVTPSNKYTTQPNMNPTWTQPEPSLSPTWTQLGSSLDPTWTQPERNLN